MDGSRWARRTASDPGRSIKRGWRISRTSRPRRAGSTWRRCSISRRGVRTADSDQTNPIAPNVVDGRFAVGEANGERPWSINQAWVADITYLPTAEGWLYLAAVLDLATRRAHGRFGSDESHCAERRRWTVRGGRGERRATLVDQSSVGGGYHVPPDRGGLALPGGGARSRDAACARPIRIRRIPLRRTS